MTQRAMLNCWIVALWLWLEGHGRAYIWSRRSLHFNGLVLHAGIAERGGYRVLKVVEYVPPKADLWTTKNFLLLFAGSYRVCHFPLCAVRRFDTKEAAVADIWSRNP